MTFNPLQNYSQGFAVASQRREADEKKSQEAELKRQRESFRKEITRGRA